MQAHSYPPVFSLGQVLCGENPVSGFALGAITATPATLLELFFNFIMMDLTGRQSARGSGKDMGTNTGQTWVWSAVQVSFLRVRNVEFARFTALKNVITFPQFLEAPPFKSI